MKAEEEELAKMKKAKPSARKHFAPKGSKGKKSHQDAAAAHAHDVDAALGALSGASALVRMLLASLVAPELVL